MSVLWLSHKYRPSLHASTPFKPTFISRKREKKGQIEGERSKSHWTAFASEPGGIAGAVCIKRCESEGNAQNNKRPMMSTTIGEHLLFIRGGWEQKERAAGDKRGGDGRSKEVLCADGIDVRLLHRLAAAVTLPSRRLGKGMSLSKSYDLGDRQKTKSQQDANGQVGEGQTIPTAVLLLPTGHAVGIALVEGLDLVPRPLDQSRRLLSAAGALLRRLLCLQWWRLYAPPATGGHRLPRPTPIFSEGLQATFLYPGTLSFSSCQLLQFIGVVAGFDREDGKCCVPPVLW